MTEINWENLDKNQASNIPLALTIGVFDGVHLGHQRLIRAICSSPGLVSAVCTFSQNPGAVLGNSTYSGSILTLAQKKQRLEGLGVEVLILIDFSHEFSTLSGRLFFQRLRRYLNIRKLVVGYNFHFGKDRDTGPEQLKRVLEGTDITLEVIPPTLYRNQVVSSSRIRAAIQKGHFAQVQDMLTKGFTFDLAGTTAESGNDRLCFDRVQIDQIIPADGLYTVVVATGRCEKEVVLEINERRLCLQEMLLSVETVRFTEKTKRSQKCH